MGVFGTQNYGRVDRIVGVGHVCTQFFHINFVPLFPVGSYFILEGVGDGDVGVSIPLSGKSILVGWLRGGLIVAAIAAAIWGLVRFTDSKDAPADPVLATLCLAGAACLLGLFFASYRVNLISQASYDRAIALGQRIGFSDETMLMIEVMHGRMTAEQADAELARREELAKQNALVMADAVESTPVDAPFGLAQAAVVQQQRPSTLS